MNQSAYHYDVYISTSPEDAEWAEEWLRPRLEAAGLRVGSEADFDLGVARIVNMERAVTGSRATLLILTPAWVRSGWAEFEAVLMQTRDVEQHTPRALPLLLEPCQPPLRIAALSYADFTQAQRRETKVQQVIAAVSGERDVKIVGATLSQFLDNRGRMLQKVQSFWVEGVLESALQSMAPLDLNLVTQPDAVPKVWDAVVQQEKAPQALPHGTPVGEVFDRYEGALLILGGAGGGKTTLLLQLARELLTRAEWNAGFPMPIVFNLSSWGRQRKPLADWIVDELNAKYDVPRKLAQTWVAEDQVIPLLDGLDEVEKIHRAACVNVINAYRQEHGFVRIAVCCRADDYEALTEQLHLRGAVSVEPLTHEQVDEYLARGGETLAGLRAAVGQDEALCELAQLPLTLGIMIEAYRGSVAEALIEQHTTGDAQRRLFAAYVDRMFARRGAVSGYSREQTVRWLAWLARGMQRQAQSILLIERLQPDWLRGRAARVRYTLLDRLGGGLIVGLVVGAVVGLVFLLVLWLAFRLESEFDETGIAGPVYFVVAHAVLGVMVGLVSGLFGGRRRIAPRERSLSGVALDVLVGGLVVGLLFALVFGLSGEWDSVLSGGLFGGLFGALFGALTGRPSLRARSIVPTERLRWSWWKATSSATPLGLVSGVAGGVVGRLVGGFFNELDVNWEIGLGHGWIDGLAFGLIGALIGGLVGGVDQGDVGSSVKPNGAIERSWRYALVFGLMVSVMSGLVFSLVFPFNLGRFLGMSFGLITALAYGGYASLSHLALRIVLWREGAIPWNYAAFLDYCAGRILLRKIGGGYIFVHRLLLEYFAALPDTPNTTTPAPLAPARRRAPNS